MSLSMLVGGGAECGPSNPLQSLTKRFDQDRGVQQDIAGPSRSRGVLSNEVHFRTHQPAVPELQQEAARFFGAGTGPAPLAPQAMSVLSMSAQPFDLAGLRDALPNAAPMQRGQIGGAADAAWVADFLAQSTASQTQAQAQGHALVSPAARVDVQPGLTTPMGGIRSGSLPWSSGYTGYGTLPMIGRTATATAAQRHVVQNDQLSWDKEFQSQEFLFNASTPIFSIAPPEQQVQQRPQDEKSAVPADEMARLAAQVIDSVKHEQNPKFRQSEFMNLMRQLRDGEVVVEEDDIVPKEGATTAGVDVKGKGRAVVQDEVAVPSTSSQSQDLASNQGLEALNAAEVQPAKDPHEAYFRRENADFTDYWNAHYSGVAGHTVSPIQEGHFWERMQSDWDAFEAIATGIQPVASYQFQTNNPYLLGDSSRTRHHSLHMSHSQRMFESVLELEAAVQRDPTNVSAWFELGVKQQENEREAKAIQALQRATELDPTHLAAWLALAVSYTNDNNRLGTYDAIREWVLRNPTYEAVVADTTLATDRRGDFPGLIDLLIQMARRADQEGNVDADVQVALAVLLNTTEDYGMAVDCFLAALAVQPDDWILYNRVGATMANNGQAQDALEYYHRALDLNPSYIRARFNLGISCINLRRYEEAASHILDALVLQDSDGVVDPAGMNELRGLTTSTLWESLKTTCLHLQRADLAAMCDRRNLSEFRRTFLGG